MYKAIIEPITAYASNYYYLNIWKQDVKNAMKERGLADDDGLGRNA